MRGSNIVNIGIDLSEFYLSVEWDILEVPATRNEEYYLPQVRLTLTGMLSSKVLKHAVCSQAIWGCIQTNFWIFTHESKE